MLGCSFTGNRPVAAPELCSAVQADADGSAVAEGLYWQSDAGHPAPAGPTQRDRANDWPHKTDGRVARCALMGTLGDALHAALCGCGHNIRMILAHLNACWAEILAVLLVTLGARGGTDRSKDGLKARAA